MYIINTPHQNNVPKRKFGGIPKRHKPCQISVCAFSNGRTKIDSVEYSFSESVGDRLYNQKGRYYRFATKNIRRSIEGQLNGFRRHITNKYGV